MTSKICPLCGNNTTKDEIFCRSCQDAAEKSNPQTLLKKTLGPKAKVIKNKDEEEVKSNINDIIEENIDNESTSVTPKKRWKPLNLFLILATVSCILTIGGYLFSQSRGIASEAAYWANTLDQNTSVAYSLYLTEYPKGKFNMTAEKKLRDLKESELDQWNNLKVSDSIDSYITYLNDYPNTPHIRAIRNRIDQLTWNSAAIENTAEAYLSYLENISLDMYDGAFKVEAQVRHSYLSELVTLEGEERENIENRMDALFDALSKKEFSLIKNYTSDTIYDFLGIQYLDKNSLVDSLSAISKRKALEVRTAKYTPIRGQTMATKDKYNVYRLSLSVSENIEYLQKDKEKKIDTLKFSVVLDASKNLQVMKKRL